MEQRSLKITHSSHVPQNPLQPSVHYPGTTEYGYPQHSMYNRILRQSGLGRAVRGRVCRLSQSLFFMNRSFGRSMPHEMRETEDRMNEKDVLWYG